MGNTPNPHITVISYKRHYWSASIPYFNTVASSSTPLKGVTATPAATNYRP